MITNTCNYHLKTKPYNHQLATYMHTRGLREYALFWEMGTGKSKPIIDTIGYLFCQCEIDGVIIVSDKGAYLNWVYEEIPKHLSDAVPRRLAHWSSAMSSRDRHRMEEIMVAKDDVLDILCINIEAFSSERITQVAEKFLRNHYAMMVVDESTSIKNLRAARTIAALRVGGLAEYRRILTGTPVTQSPLDLFAQCQFLRPGILGFNSFTAFRSYYAQTILQRFGNRKPFPQIVGYRNLEMLSHSLKKFSSRLLKTECLDLPDKVYEMQFIEHTPEQAMQYEMVKRTAVAAFDKGLLTVTNALSAINKLQQINCGHVKLDDGTVVEIPSNRVDVLMTLLESLGDQKVIIWCAFQMDVELICRALDRVPDKYYVTYYGKTPADERQQNLKDFHEDPKTLWLVGTAATGGKAITLVESHTTIYFSNTYNLEDRLQSEDRNHRIGQVKKVTYIDFVTPKTVDTKILDSLKSKKDLASEVLDNFRMLID